MDADRVALRELGEGSRAVQEVLDTGRPKVITSDGGDAVAAIVDAATYQSILDDAAASLLRDLQEAAHEAAAGDLIDHNALMAQVRRRFSGRVPAELLDQFSHE
jgi:PHD/YefM family antitoxin component YafN of YafNO toxin-antitoxin module